MASKTWIASGYGLWSDGANWTAGAAPGAADAATLVGSSLTFQTVAGVGTASSLAVFGNISLAGQVGTGSLQIGTASNAGALTLSTGASLSAITAVLLYGPVQVGGAGARLTVTGSLTLGGGRIGTSFVANALSASLGGSVQAGSLVLAPSAGGNAITVDATSSIEIGSAGSALAGKLTVDAGRILNGTGSITAAGGVLNQGIILAQGGTLSIGGAVTGTGLMQIGTAATLYLHDGISTQGVQFTGTGGTLELTLAPTAAQASSLTAQGVITGFVAGDLLYFASGTPVSSVSYQAGAGGLGTLTLYNGTATIGALTLVGSYASTAFQVAPAASYGYTISLGGAGPTGSGSTGTGTGTTGTGTTGSGTTGAGAGTSTGSTTGASAGTATPDAYLWAANGSAVWNSPFSWRDTTTGANPAPVPPGANNLVTIQGGTGTAVTTVTGPGNAASLAVLGNTALAGNFGAGGLNVGTAAATGALSLTSGAVVTAGSATILYGSLQASSTGTRLAVANTLTLGGARTGTSYIANVLTLASGAVVQAGSVVLAPSTAGDSISIDATSILEVGTAGGALGGKLTIDAGRSFTGAGNVSTAAGVVNQGMLTAQGGTLSIGGAVTGTGQTVIGSGATLYLYNGVSTQGASFLGGTGTLEFTTTPDGLSEQGVVSGFLPGDTLYYASGNMLSSVTYTVGSGGVGALTLNGTTGPLGTLSVAGKFARYNFIVTPQAYGATITLADRFLPVTDPLFDTGYYLDNNPDIAAAGINPYQHYMLQGWKEGRDPSALFHTAYYLNQNPDIARAGINPLAHFEASGWKEGRDPSAAFSISGYLAANLDVKAAGVDSLVHYVMAGKTEGRAAPAATPHPVGTPDPLVDYAWYYAQHPDVAASGMDASAHYHTIGAALGYNPDPFFDTNFYLAQNPDVKAAGIDPLAHFEAGGWREGREPSLLFSDAKYLAANPDVRAAGMDPLLHYVLAGRAEGRIAFVSTPADPLVDAAYYNAQLPAPVAVVAVAGSYNLTGWRAGLNPDAFFDTNYYLSHNPDVRAAGINPLQHFEANGWKEGRDPSALFSISKYMAAYSDVRAAGVDPLLHYITSGQTEGRTAFHV